MPRAGAQYEADVCGPARCSRDLLGTGRWAEPRTHVPIRSECNPGRRAPGLRARDAPGNGRHGVQLVVLWCAASRAMLGLFRPVLAAAAPGCNRGLDPDPSSHI